MGFGKIAFGFARRIIQQTTEKFPTESVRYALQPELLMLYVMSLVGWQLVEFSQSFSLPIAGGFRTVEALSSLPLTVSGMILLIGGVVGIVHYILEDFLLEGE
jgi:hypothetical protein